LGKDLGPSPIEEMLVALAVSVTRTLAYRASATQLTIQVIECGVEADLNTSTAVENKTQSQQSFEQSRGTLRVNAEASKDELALLCRSPAVLNALIKPIPVNVTIKND